MSFFFLAACCYSTPFYVIIETNKIQHLHQRLSKSADHSIHFKDDDCKIHAPATKNSAICPRPEGVNCYPVCSKVEEDVELGMWIRSDCNVSW